MYSIQIERVQKNHTQNTVDKAYNYTNSIELNIVVRMKTIRLKGIMQNNNQAGKKSTHGIGERHTEKKKY